MKKRSNKRVGKWLFWTPRILTILFLLFLAIFSLDIFDLCNNFSSCALGLLMHNIPVFILIIILWISWKHELVGAIAFALAGLLYIITLLIKPIFVLSQLFWTLPISLPAFLISYLFYLNYKKKE